MLQLCSAARRGASPRLLRSPRRVESSSSATRSARRISRNSSFDTHRWPPPRAAPRRAARASLRATRCGARRAAPHARMLAALIESERVVVASRERERRPLRALAVRSEASERSARARTVQRTHRVTCLRSRSRSRQSSERGRSLLHLLLLLLLHLISSLLLSTCSFCRTLQLHSASRGEQSEAEAAAARGARRAGENTKRRAPLEPQVCAARGDPLI